MLTQNSGFAIFCVYFKDSLFAAAWKRIAFITGHIEQQRHARPFSGQRPL
jgi:hypothetical protein